jgi:ion channel-forming bestrophin family protein
VWAASHKELTTVSKPELKEANRGHRPKRTSHDNLIAARTMSKSSKSMNSQIRQGFWREAVALQGSITPRVIPLVLTFGLIAGATCLVSWLIEKPLQVRLALAVAPFEFAGAALAVLLVLRTNAGYDRWWEARKLWGGIVNQSRNLVISSMSYGPANPEWRDALARWTAAFPHVARHSLRGEEPSSEVSHLVGSTGCAEIATSAHMPSFVALKLADLLRDACDRFGMDRFAFIQIDRERALLIDHIGACERILKTPLPRLYSIKIRRFIVLFLLTLPLALIHRLNGDWGDWLVPVITMLVAYPLLSLDQIGIELENPFASTNLSHLPLDDICTTIESNLLGMLKATPAEGASTAGIVRSIKEAQLEN